MVLLFYQIDSIVFFYTVKVLQCNSVGVYYSLASEFIHWKKQHSDNPIGVFHSLASEFIHWYKQRE